MNELGFSFARGEGRRERRSGVHRLRVMLTVLVAVALALPSTGCSFFLIDSACRGFTVEDPLLDIYFMVWAEPLRPGVVTARPADSLHLFVGHDGEAMMVREPKLRELVRGRCRPLAADDLAEVMRAVERLEHSVVAERKVSRPDCLDMTTIVLRGDRLLKSFNYCGKTPPAEVVRFVEEISVPLGRQFGKELAAGLAATATWASPVLLD